jgi:ribosome biogenesis GTPase / thiamine phosphate phosphatase
MTGRMEAILCGVHRRGAEALVGDEVVSVRLSGRLRLAGSPAVGDLVIVSAQSGVLVAEEIMPRRNSLERPVMGGTQVIAANLDAVLILSSVNSPPLRRGFIDRNAAAAEHQGIPVIVAVNKMDLAGPGEAGMVDSLEADCTRAGMGFIRMSCASGAGIVEVKTAVYGRSVVITGPSGAGKTTLVNLLGGSGDLPTGDLNLKTGKGRHTTVAARMILLACGGRLIDTPGLRVFPLSNITPSDLQMCFREIGGLRGGCRFRDCLHAGEPDCAVARAVESGTVSRDRYESYRGLLEEVSRG